MSEVIKRFLVCPYTRKEIVVTPKNHKVFCPECKMYHLLPDGVSRSMEKLKECVLVFTNNGSDFYLEPVKTVK